MGEPIWCSIQAKVPATWFDGPEPGIVTMLGAALCGGDAMTDSGDGFVTITVNGEGNYGLCDSYVEDALDWMEKHRVPYVAESEAKYDFLGEIRLHSGRARRIWTGVTSGDMVVLTEPVYKDIVTGRSSGYVSVEDYFERFGRNVDTLSIEHLPERYPEEE